MVDKMHYYGRNGDIMNDAFGECEIKTYQEPS